MLRVVLLFSDLPNRSNLTNLTNTTIEQNYSKANMTNLTNMMIGQNDFKINMEMIEQLLRGMVFFLLFLLVSRCNLCQSCYYGFALRYKDSDGYKILLVLYMLRGFFFFPTFQIDRN